MPLFEMLRRAVRYHLIIPLLRTKQPPHHVARGVMVGVFWAMTPFFGIQMLLVLATWLLTTRLLRWQFSLVDGLAWVWVTNVFTILPFFYLFYITGAYILAPAGHDIASYSQFSASWQDLRAQSESGFLDMLGWAAVLFGELGKAIAIGSALWAVTLAIVAYLLITELMMRWR